MTSPLGKRLQILLSILSVLAVLALAALAWGYFQMRGSLAQLDGSRPLAGLAAPVQIARDAHGVPRLTGTNRADVARALGFVHAQDRFFQMDLMRRRAAGELAELFGPAAVSLDEAARLHGCRRLATQAVAALPAEQRTILEAYTAGVNAGLAALDKKPWEYLVLRLPPTPWKAEDSMLCVYAMWFDLQDSTGSHDLERRALQVSFGLSGLAFFSPRGTSADAALDGSTFPAAELPSLRLKQADEKNTAALDWSDDTSLLPGSNSFAVDGAHTATGAAMLANDMHLGLAVPHVWYRAELNWQDASGGAHRVVGVTLPGAPTLIAGSNGDLAWGFTNSYIDTTDAAVIETYADIQYRTPTGWKDIEERTETIKVKGKPDVPFIARWTEWGPIVATAEEGRSFALRWSAHVPEATNLTLMEFETARSVEDAIGIAHRVGMPNQNILLADRAGRIAWTITGKIPKRIGYDGRLPVTWGYGDRRWDGWMPESEVPVVSTQPLGRPGEIIVPEGALWTANNRIIGGKIYEKLGDGGYDNGFRGGAIRDDLRELLARKKAESADLLAIQLDDRARYLDRWQKLLLEVLTDDAVAQKKARGPLRDLARAWGSHAAIDSAGYRIVRTFRLKVAERALAPFADKPELTYAAFKWGTMTEDAVWRLITEKPVRLLNPAHRSWDSLLLAAADDVLADADREGLTLARYTWGARNTLKMQHPFARILPGWIAPFISMPAEQLPGDSNLPRVQGISFGQSERFIISPGHEDAALLNLPGGASGHPLSPFFRAGHDDWARGRATPLLPGPAAHTLTLTPQ